jgi:hypothetical protein
VEEAAPASTQAVLVVREAGFVPEVEFAEEVVEIRIQVSLGRLHHVDFPVPGQAWSRLFAVQDAVQTVVGVIRDLLRLLEGIEMVAACPA